MQEEFDRVRFACLTQTVSRILRRKSRKRSKILTKISFLPGDKQNINIDRDEVQRLISDGAQPVEVLPSEEYNEAHLPGAINLPLKKLDVESMKILDPIRPVITYCHDFQ